MIDFKPIELSDKIRVQKYTMVSGRRNCDLSFLNLYSWCFLYQTEIAEKGGFLLFRFRIENELSYMMPVGEGNVKPVIEAMIEDAVSGSAKFRMFGVCEDMCEKLKEAFPGQFDFVADRDYADYVYLRSDLASLRGKKYQPKRNHINRFKTNYPDYEYKPLSHELVSECLRLENLWCKTNDCAENKALQNERRSMVMALQHIDELDLKGGVLYVGDEIVAFTYGAPINRTTFDVCVEKANTEFEGSYAMINYEFANHIPEQYLYINREEDLGLEGLRKAKLSYHPDVVLEKYMVTLK